MGGVWTVPIGERRGALQLVCFPPGGGGAAAFADWKDGLPGIDVLAIRPPGRESRFAEPAFDRIDALVGALVPALLPQLAPRFAFFGHSIGALIAFEVALVLRAHGLRQPLHLFVAGKSAPHVPRRHPPMSTLPHDEFLALLRRLGGTDDAVLAHGELLQILTPMLRADFSLSDTYAFGGEPPLRVPITAFAGEADPYVEVADVEQWRAVTAAPFKFHVVPGGHYFPRTERAALLSTILAELHPATAPDSIR
jgi:medium-chain acyl-[acyl-carrier-protein] hydrolase